MMERGVRRKSHAPCEAGEKVAITSKSYLSLSERMEVNGNNVIPLRSSLPDHCFSVLAETGEMIIIKKGESGYYHSDLNCNDATVSRVVAAENNKRLGVSKIQEECMVAGSMFGWDVPGADSKNYDATGRFCPSKPKDRGDAR